MGLLSQIVVLLLVAAALGFAVGWLVRGGQLQAERGTLEAEWQARLRTAESECARLQAELDSAKAQSEPKGGVAQSGASDGDGKFRAAKRAFARLYHPDNVNTEGFDKVIRVEIFKEYWRELEAIEKGVNS